MDATRLEHLLRSLSDTPPRRTVAQALIALGLTGPFGILHDFIDAEAKKKRRKKKKKRPCAKCSSCQVCQNNACVAKSDDSACDTDGKCLNGTCNPLPTCVRYGHNCGLEPSSCCGAICPGGGGTGELCGPSGFDQPCVADEDCSSNDCVGYRCRKGGPGANCLFDVDCESNSCNHTAGSTCD